jgi:hypothetical protein
VLIQGYLYDGALRPIAELDGSNAVVSRFVYGSRANVPDYMVKGGVTYRIVSDHLGSPRLIVDVATGAVAQQVAYDEFGTVLTDTHPGFPVWLRGRVVRPQHGAGPLRRARLRPRNRKVDDQGSDSVWRWRHKHVCLCWSESNKQS